MKSQDIVVLLKLQPAPGPVRVRELATSLGYDAAGTHRSVKRLVEAGLYVPGRGVPLGAAVEFVAVAARYFFQAFRGGQTRGVLTAWAAATPGVSSDGAGEHPLVWSSPDGPAWGVALTPLHPIVLPASAADPQLHRRLAIVDVLRDGSTRRDRSKAKAMLQSELRDDEPPLVSGSEKQARST